MSYGFLATNNNNQVLVSSDTRNLHFIQKLTTPFAVDLSSDYFGGIRKWRYRATVKTAPMPFFTMPTSDFYGVTQITQIDANTWDIEVVRSGTSTTVPELYIFADPRGVDATEAYGMIVYNEDGTKSFDSRLRPLVAFGASTVNHPSVPKATSNYVLSAKYCEASIDSRSGVFQPDANAFNSYPIIGAAAVKPMYFFASLAQSERESFSYQSEDDCDGVDAYGGCIGFGRDYQWWSWYWCFYRGGIRIGYDQIGPIEVTTHSSSILGLTQTANYQTYCDDNGCSEQFTGYTNNYTTYTPVENGSTFFGTSDDGYWSLATPFAIWCGNNDNTAAISTNVINISTNGYVTFGSGNGSATYIVSAVNPSYFKVMFGGGDRRAIALYVTVQGSAPNRTVTYRYEGYKNYNNTTGPADIKFEIRCYENNRSIDFIDDGTNWSGWTGITPVYGAASSTTQIGTLQSTPFNLRIAPGYVKKMQAGWIPHTFGCNWKYEKDSSFIGIDTGGGGSTGGSWPYSNETINLINNAVIIGDASYYD